MENLLTAALFEAEGYNPLIRPVKDMTQVTNVSVQITLFQVLNVVSMSLKLYTIFVFMLTGFTLQLSMHFKIVQSALIIM